MMGKLSVQQKDDVHVLMISPMPVWPVNAGERVRIWHIATGLAQHLRVTLVVPCYDDSKNLAYAEDRTSENLTIEPVWLPKPGIFRSIQSVFTNWPYHTRFYYDKKMAQAVRHLLATQRFSLIYCHFIHALPYVINIDIPLTDIPVVLDPQNVDRLYWQRKIDACHNTPLLRRFMQQNLHKTICFEEKMLTYVSIVVSVSEQERRLTQQYADALPAHLWVVENGVDIDVYHPKLIQADSRDRNEERQLVLGFFGSMNLVINQDAALLLVHEIYPLVKKRLSCIDVSVHIIGRNPPRKICTLAHNDPNIIVSGTLKNLLPSLHQIDLLVLPLQSGAGTKLRVLEAMAAGVPIVGSPLAFAGLDKIVPGCHVLEAETIIEFVDAIEKIALNGYVRSQIPLHAREVVVGNYQWSQITTRLAEKLFNYC